MFGNTHEVAERIGAGLGGQFDVAVMSVGDAIASVVPEAELVVVGGPTHAHGMSRNATRKGAADQAADADELHLEPGADGPGLREWFDALPKVGSAMAAAFDTRVDGPVVVTGHASKAIAKRLSRHGFRLVADPESFLVDRHNALVAGEADRAEQWAARLAEQAATV
jgi:hypothetical protein